MFIGAMNKPDPDYTIGQIGTYGYSSFSNEGDNSTGLTTYACITPDGCNSIGDGTILVVRVDVT